MPGRVRSRRQFERLSHPDRRGRKGPVRVSFAEPVEASESFQVAYAIGKDVGNAVERNRIRRRLRSLMDELRPDLRSGLYLIKCDFRAKESGYDDLGELLRGALRDAGLCH